MSSRAMRKLQREEEEKNRLAKLQENQDSSEDDGDGGGVRMSHATTAKVNAFDMLNAADENANFEGASHGSQGSAISSDADNLSPNKQQDALKSAETYPQNESQAKKKKKSKKKKKKPQKSQLEDDQSLRPKAKSNKINMDEIDLALLSLKGKNPVSNDQDDGDQKPNKELLQLYTLLATNTKNLSSLTEMKKLFGNVVVEEENQEPAAQAPGRGRNRRHNAADHGGNLLGGLLAARNSPVSRGKGLAGLALRRNVFMAGKDSWPKATSGGLSMEVVEKPWDMTTEYRWVHNKSYQDVQKQFYTCVDSMDPERVIQLLQFNPYHISTLLVVSDISEQQGDHTLSGELLERALFSFGRSVHSTFPASIAEGKARMDFRLSENREFWVSVWRYITHLGQRGTWRTAYEWAKLLLSLDPEGDPYCLRLIMDQLALRGGQSENFVEMAALLNSQFSWGRDSPNIQISLGLAQYKLKRAELCRTVLRSSVKKFPWVFLRLFQELNIQSTPKSIWGKLPQSDHDKLETESYVTRAKDLWNTPEAISLLVEVVESVDDTVLRKGPEVPVPISRNEARHILLAGIPSLISLLPREHTTAPSSSIDVLPPFDSYNTYEPSESFSEESDDDNDVPEQTSASGPPQEGEITRQEIDEQLRELNSIERIFARFLPFLANRSAIPNPIPDGYTAEEFLQGANFTGYRAQQEQNEEDEDDEQEDEEMPELEPPSDNDAWDAIAAQVETALREAIAAEEGRVSAELQAPFQSHPVRELNRRLEGAAAAPGPHTPIGPYSEPLRPLNSVPDNVVSPAANSPPDASNGSQAHSSVIENARHNLNLQVGSDFLDPNEPCDEEANKRWLAGRGIRLVESFTARYGADVQNWMRMQECSYNNPVIEYSKRLRLLSQAQRNHFINYVLQQQVDADTRDQVKRLVENQDDLGTGTGGWREGHKY